MALQSGQIAAKGISLGGLFQKGTTNIQEDKVKFLHQTLQDITKLNRNCQYSYLLMMKNGEIYVIADSDQELSDEQSLQVVHYSEAEEEYYQSFHSKRGLVAKNVKDPKRFSQFTEKTVVPYLFVSVYSNGYRFLTNFFCSSHIIFQTKLPEPVGR